MTGGLIMDPSCPEYETPSPQ
ncbi:unnamed protein product, partial [Adineta steineri]